MPRRTGLPPAKSEIPLEAPSKPAKKRVRKTNPAVAGSTGNPAQPLQNDSERSSGEAMDRALGDWLTRI